MNSHGLNAAVGSSFQGLLINLSFNRDVHELIVILDLTMAQHHLLSKAFVFSVPGSLGVPFNPSILSVCPYSSIFRSRNHLNMRVFLVLQILENYFSPDNFSWRCLEFLWVFQQK